MNDEYFSDLDLALLLNLNVESLRNKISADQPLPPSIRPPGNKHRLRRRSSADAWLRKHEVGEE